jgi:hypothetical protein
MVVLLPEGTSPTWTLALASSIVIAGYVLARLIRTGRHSTITTALRGPPSPSFLTGQQRVLRAAHDPTPVYDAWFAEYGPAFVLPLPLGRSRIVLGDPKAIAHVFARDTWDWSQPTLTKIVVEALVSRCELSLIV